MELLDLLRSLGGLMAVLAMLAGALWVVRRYDIRLPGRIGGGTRARLAVVERLAIDGKRSLLLIRRDGAEHLLLLGPEGAIPIGEAVPMPPPPAPFPDFLPLPRRKAPQPLQPRHPLPQRELPLRAIPPRHDCAPPLRQPA